MDRVLFATSNERKINEASRVLARFGVEISPVDIGIDEIQHERHEEIAKAKAITAHSQLNAPVVVSDTCWSIPALGGFPGGYMKDVSAWLATEDWMRLMGGHQDKRIMCMENVAYCDSRGVEFFSETYTGVFVDAPRGAVQDFESFESLVVLHGGQTMAEQLESGGLASAGEELGHWLRFGKWYTSR